MLIYIHVCAPIDTHRESEAERQTEEENERQRERSRVEAGKEGET